MDYSNRHELIKSLLMRKSFFILFIFCIFFTGCEKDKKQVFIFEKNVSESSILESEKEEIKTDNLKTKFVCWVTSKEGLRVRNIPDLSGNKIGLLEYKKEVEVYEIGKKEEIDNIIAFWLKIKFENSYGWIFGGYVTVIPETPDIKIEDLPLTENNLAGTWTQRSESSYITMFSIGEVFEVGGRYYSGLLHSSWGTSGFYKIDYDKQEILITESIIDDENIDDTVHMHRLKVKKLTTHELVYEYISENGQDIQESRKYKRIPERFLNLKKAQTEEWLRYINQYGNEELFTGSTVFMYSVLNRKNDVALFLINSEIDINHQNKSGDKAIDFLRTNEDNYLYEILKHQEGPVELDPNELDKQSYDVEEQKSYLDFDDLLDFESIKIENSGWIL